MKFLITVVLLIPVWFSANAQPWMPLRGGPVKFEDAVARYERIETEEREEHSGLEGEGEREDENYQFDRWYWYWHQHLDTNGYMVSAKRNIMELSSINSRGVGAKTTATSNWVFQGPGTSAGGQSGLGRINVVGFDPVDSNTFYAGSGLGGTWKTTDGGNTWVCLYDVMSSLGVSDIKVNPMNRNTVYVATGDAIGAGGSYAAGIIRSNDGGTTWVEVGPAGLADSLLYVYTLLINPSDTNILTIGTSKGIYRTSNAGATWTRYTSESFRQIIYCPTDTAIMYGTKWVSSTGGWQVARSTDGGYTWSVSTSFSSAIRIALAVTPAAPNKVMAIAASASGSAFKAISVSLDYGFTFTDIYVSNPACTTNLLGYDHGLPTTMCFGQGWYDLCIAIDPLDANKVVVGGIHNYYSADGGYSWTIANLSYPAGPDIAEVHADKHWLGHNPLNNALFLGCDGGIYKNYAPLTGEWKDLTNGMGITMFYRNAVDNAVTYCLGGSQDNGTKKLDGTTFTDLLGGDGMQCQFDYSDPTHIFYCEYQDGNLAVTMDGGTTFTSAVGALPLPGAWITPYVLHPSVPSTLFIGLKRVYKSTNYGTSWVPISPEFSGYYKILILANALSDSNYIYVVRDNYSSIINYTPNGGTTWDTIATPFPGSVYISDLVVDPLDAKHFWVTLSGYSAHKVYGYNLATNTWTNESDGLPDVPVNCMVIDSSSQTKYVGTDVAVFYKTAAMTSWALYNNHLPGVEVYDLNINYTTDDIWAATYGRGMWKSQKAEPTDGSVKINNYTDETQSLKVSPNPCHEAFSIYSSAIPFRNAFVSFKLINMDGRTVLKSTGTFNADGRLSINLPNVPPGIYCCMVSTENSQARCKVVVY